MLPFHHTHQSTYIISLGGRPFHPSVPSFVPSSIHPFKFLIPEEEDDGGLHSVRRSRVPTSIFIYAIVICPSRKQVSLSISRLSLCVTFVGDDLFCAVGTVEEDIRLEHHHPHGCSVCDPPKVINFSHPNIFTSFQPHP